LFYSDDELDEKFERDLDEVARAIEYSDHKKFNHGHCRTTLIVGGPMAPNYEGKSNNAEKASLKKEWEKKRKQFTDKKRNKRLKADSLNKDKRDAYTGCLRPTLRTMVEVEKSRLKAGHTYFKWIYFRLFLVVTQFLRKWKNSPKLPSLFAAAPALVPCPFSAPSRAVFVAPALVPGPSASALACRRRRHAGSRPWPVGVRPRLPSAPPRMP
jgi:hypothetical protein